MVAMLELAFVLELVFELGVLSFRSPKIRLIISVIRKIFALRLEGAPGDGNALRGTGPKKRDGRRRQLNLTDQQHMI